MPRLRTTSALAEADTPSKEGQTAAAFSTTPLREGLQDSSSPGNADSKVLFAEHLFKPDTEKS